MDARQTGFGQEQGHLDGIDEPIVEVVALRIAPPLSPSLGLLGYRNPLGACDSLQQTLEKL